MSSEPNQALPLAVQDEPIKGWAQTPISLVALLVLLVFFGLISLADNAGEFHGQVYEPYRSYAEVSTNQPSYPPPGGSNGKLLFGMNCAVCHGVEALGTTISGAPPLAGSDWVNAENPDRIIRIVLNGLSGPITVSEKQYGTGVMIPWRDTTLSDEQIAAILTYIRGNKEWSNNASLVSAEQVRAVRKITEEKAGPWTAADLEKIPVKN